MGKRGLGRAGSLGRGGRRGSARGRARTACRARAARALSASTCTRYSVCGSSQADVGRRGLGRSGGLGEGGAAAHVIAYCSLSASVSRVLHPPRDRRWPRWRVAHLVGRRAGMVERAWQSSGAGLRTTATCRAARRAQRGRHDDMDGRVCEASGGFGILAWSVELRGRTGRH